MDPDLRRDDGEGARAPLAGCKGFPYILPMIISRISSKAQTTIPRAIRAALGLREGDRLTYEIEGERVILRRADPVEDPFATFTEWADEADSAYDVLDRG